MLKLTVPGTIRAVVYGHGIGGQAMGSGQDPIVSNYGTSAHGSIVHSQAHSIWCLAFVGWIAIYNDVLGTTTMMSRTIAIPVGTDSGNKQ